MLHTYSASFTGKDKVSLPHILPSLSIHYVIKFNIHNKTRVVIRIKGTGRGSWECVNRGSCICNLVYINRTSGPAVFEILVQRDWLYAKIISLPGVHFHVLTRTFCVQITTQQHKYIWQYVMYSTATGLEFTLVACGYTLIFGRSNQKVLLVFVSLRR